MANMEYCRFENTLRDLLDCQKHLDDDTNLLGDSEKAARKRLIEVCVEIATDYGNP